jgi:hypothetical protein
MVIISRILLISGGLVLVTAFFLPTWQDVYTSRSSDFDYGFSWGMQEGYVIWVTSVMTLFSPYCIFLATPALFAIAQIYYAFMPNRSIPHIVMKWSFVITSLATPAFLHLTKEASYPLIGYYVWQTGYWLTTVGLLMRQNEKEELIIAATP